MAKKNKNNNQGTLFKKEIPKMPDGYYSGDKPNPNLRKFVERHLKEKPYDPENDDYDVPAFDKPIQTKKTTAIYNMHTYWSKKPHDAIRQYIRHYTEPGDLVLDPFCGSGGTALAALMEGRKAVAIDRSPAATFITKNYCTPVDVGELQTAFEELKKKVKPEIDWLYETRCDRCGGEATTAYTVYSQVFQCPRCLEKIPLFDCVEGEGVTNTGKPKKIRVCPHCKKRNINEEISTRGEKFGVLPVLVNYICKNGCKPERGERLHNDPDPEKRRYFEEYDLAKLKEIEKKEIPHWYPTHRMMHAPEEQECWGVKWRAGTSNFKTVDELFTKRNLWALAIIRNALDDSSLRDTLLFAFTGICLGFSKMCQWIPNASYPFPMMRGTYYMPQIFKEQLVPHYYKNRIALIKKKNEKIELTTNSFITSTEDSRFLPNVPSNSIDSPFKVKNNVWELPISDVRLPSSETVAKPKPGKNPQKTFSSIIFPKTGYAFKRPHGHFNPDAFSHGGISIQELLIPMVVMKVKPQDEGILVLDEIVGPKDIVEGEEIDLKLKMYRSKKGDGKADDLRVDIEASYSADSEPVDLPAQVLFVTSKGTDCIVNFKPDTAGATPDERREGAMKRTLTVTATYRDGHRIRRKTARKDFVVQLNSEQVVRRVPTHLGNILGLTPKSMR